MHVRPSPLPITLTAAPAFRNDLARMALAIAERPFDLRCRVDVDMLGVPSSVTASNDDLRFRLPVIGRWPIDDLSPRGLVALFDQLHGDAEKRAGMAAPQRDGLDALASYVVALCRITDRLPPHMPFEQDGSVDVEVCRPDEGGYSFWVVLRDGEDTFFELKPDPLILAKATTPPPLPCHVWPVTEEDGETDCVGPSMSDQEGVMVQASPLDPMAELRLHALVSEHVATWRGR